MAKTKLVARRLDTPLPDTSPHTTGLPDALASEHVRRLAVCAAVGAGLWTSGLVMDTIVRPMTLGIAVPGGANVIEILAIAASLLMFGYARYAPDTHERKTDAGLVYVV